MNALKEPGHITLAEGLKHLESRLPAEEAKARLRQAFIQRAFIQSEAPIFALSYDEAEIDWTTGSVKIPRQKVRFCPTFGRTDFNAYFFKDHAAAKQISEEPRKDRLIAEEKRPELLTLKPGVWGVSVDLKELVRRVKAWWERKK
jgi:hypothetical protein